MPPEDKTITTLYVGGIGDDIEEQDLKYCNKILIYQLDSSVHSP